MADMVQWWELALPRTTRGCLDAKVRISSGRLHVVFMSEKAKMASSAVVEQLRWARLGIEPSPAYPWRKARAAIGRVLEVLHFGPGTVAERIEAAAQIAASGRLSTGARGPLTRARPGG